MTYSSSLNSGSIGNVRLRFEFGGQELSNGVFESIVRRRENRLWYMANQTDGRCFLPFSSVRWARIPIFVYTAAACDFVAVDKEEGVRTTTDACWDGSSERGVVEI